MILQNICVCTWNQTVHWLLLHFSGLESNKNECEPKWVLILFRIFWDLWTNSFFPNYFIPILFCFPFLSSQLTRWHLPGCPTTWVRTMRTFTSQWRRPNPNRPKWWPFDVQSSADSTFCSLTDWPVFFLEFNKWTNSPLTSTWVESWGSSCFLLYSRKNLKELKITQMHCSASGWAYVTSCMFQATSTRLLDFERMFSPLVWLNEQVF